MAVILLPLTKLNKHKFNSYFFYTKGAMKAIKRKWIANQLFNFKKENELIDFTLNGYIIEWRFDSTKHETRIKIDFAANKSRYFLNGKSHIKHKKKQAFSYI
jgi:hypothetical protein